MENETKKPPKIGMQPHQQKEWSDFSVGEEFIEVTTLGLSTYLSSQIKLKE